MHDIPLQEYYADNSSKVYIFKQSLLYILRLAFILHQLIIILLGFFIYNLGWLVPVKLLYLVLVSFTIIMCLYHFIIRRVNILRVLFGLKEMRKETIGQETVEVRK